MLLFKPTSHFYFWLREFSHYFFNTFQYILRNACTYLNFLTMLQSRFFFIPSLLILLPDKIHWIFQYSCLIEFEYWWTGSHQNASLLFEFIDQRWFTFLILKAPLSLDNAANIFSVSKTMLSFGNGRKHHLKRMFEMFPKCNSSRCVNFFCTEWKITESSLI